MDFTNLACDIWIRDGEKSMSFLKLLKHIEHYKIYIILWITFNIKKLYILLNLHKISNLKINKEKINFLNIYM